MLNPNNAVTWATPSPSPSASGSGFANGNTNDGSNGGVGVVVVGGSNPPVVITVSGSANRSTVADAVAYDGVPTGLSNAAKFTVTATINGTEAAATDIVLGQETQVSPAGNSIVCSNSGAVATCQLRKLGTFKIQVPVSIVQGSTTLGTSTLQFTLSTSAVYPACGQIPTGSFNVQCCVPGTSECSEQFVALQNSGSQCLVSSSLFDQQAFTVSGSSLQFNPASPVFGEEDETADFEGTSFSFTSYNYAGNFPVACSGTL
jgi:hypothetical protein